MLTEGFNFEPSVMNEKPEIGIVSQLKNRLPTGLINESINLESFIAEAKIEIESKGYYIAKKLITQDWYNSCREQSIKYFDGLNSNTNDLPTALRGSICAGMADSLGYEKNKAWHIYRYCGFRWNRPNQDLVKIIKTSHSLSRIRNVIYGTSEDYGDFIEENNFFTYTSLSLYPLKGGFLNKHIDFKRSWNIQPMIHFKVELTHKGQDYKEGGFYITDKLNRLICVSDLVRPTDVIFFEGSQPHEIAPIGDGDYGRMAFFEIPASVTPASRECIYAGDGYSFPKKILSKLLTKIP